MKFLRRGQRIVLTLLVLSLIITACGVSEEPAAEPDVQPIEQAAEQSAEQTTNTNTVVSTQPNPTPTSAAIPQNDANSGTDAGNADAPALLTAGTGFSGMLTGAQNGGDIIDVYQIQANAHQIVRVMAQSDAANSADLTFEFSNTDGYDITQTTPTSETAVLTLASANDNLYTLTVSHDGTAETAVYTFDIMIEDEDDANSGADAQDMSNPHVIQPDITYQGVSVGDLGGGNDPDCYQIVLPGSGGIQINLSAPADQPYESFARAELYDSTQTLLTSNTADFGSSALLEYGVADYETAVAGNYTLCIESYENYAYGAYEFTVTFTGINDACLIGTWRVTNFDDYLLASVRDAMDDESVEISSTSTGDLLLTFDGEIMSMSDNNFLVNMTMMGVAVPVAIDASGTAVYTADGTIITGFVEAVDVSDTNTGMGISLGGLVGNPVTYTCSGTTMSWSAPFPTTIQFEKIAD